MAGLGPWGTSCRRPGCRCTHEAPCDRGWIETEDDKTTPCLTCREELAVAVRDARDRDELRRNLAVYRQTVGAGSR